MYIPSDFELADQAIIFDFLQQHAFGTLVVNGKTDLPVVSHLPFSVCQVDGKIIVEAHLAKVNEQVVFLENGKSAKMIVTGAHGYVSSSVYGHVNVPTYNYQAVHLSGTLELLTKAELLDQLKSLVTNYESNRDQPIDFDLWPVKMIELYLEEIVGFRLTVFKTEAAFKLSQNRNFDDYQQIINDLNKGNINQQALALEMQKWRRERI